MPMVAEDLKNEILVAMMAKGFTKTDGNEKLAAAIAEAVVTHIKKADVIGTCPPGGGPLANGKVL